MTPVSIRILALAAVASLPLLAQQPSQSPQPGTPSSAQPNTPQQTNPEPGASEGSNPRAVPAPSVPEVANAQLRPVTGELEGKLDTKDAKTGDSVVVKTTETASTANGIEIPKGSRIEGHIVDVAAKGQGGDNSRVTIQFDDAEVKGGQKLPIRSVIQSISPAGGTAGADAAGGPSATTPSSGSTATGGGAGMTGSRPSGNSSPSAGPSDSTQPATAGQSPSAGTAGQSANAGQSAAGGQSATAGQSAAGGQSGTAGSEAGGAAPAPGTVIATRGNIAIRTTSIPGVLLIGSVSGQPFSNASGALLGAKQDVHLDGGTVMVVAIAAAPAPVNGK